MSRKNFSLTNNQIGEIINPLSLAQGINMTYAASGSTGIAVADDDDIDYGTGNFFGVIPVLLADYTPSAEVVLEQKTDGTNGREFTLQTNGKLRVTINTTDYDSTVATGCTDNTKHVFGYSVTRETAAAAGSIIFVVDGVQLGDAVTITAGAPTTINNAVSQYVLGTSATRTAGRVNGYISGNRALTAAEHLALYRNGIAYTDKWGNQTAVYTSDFSAGVDGWSAATGATATGNVDSINGSDNWVSIERNVGAGTGYIFAQRVATLSTNVRYAILVTIYNPAGSGFAYFSASAGGSSATVTTIAEGTEWTGMMYLSGAVPITTLYIYPCTAAGFILNTAAEGKIWYFKAVSLWKVGATLALEPEGIQPAPGQWLDSSTNNLHALQPSSGSSLTQPKYDFTFKATIEWSASNTARHINVGNVDQAVLTSKSYITSIISKVTVSTSVKDIQIGDGSDADRYVATVTPSGTQEHTLANNINDGINLKLVVTPADTATMTIEFTVLGIILE